VEQESLTLVYLSPLGPPQEKEDVGDSVKPQLFKALVGKGHSEFSSNRQQVQCVVEAGGGVAGAGAAAGQQGEGK